MPDPIGIIFCDEVRQESNGKFFFIGVYTGQIVVPSFPWVSRITPVLLMSGSPGDLNKLKVRASSKSGAEYAVFETAIEADMSVYKDGEPPLTGVLPLPAFVGQMSAPDQLLVEIAVNDGDLRVFGAISVLKGTTPPIGG